MTLRHRPDYKITDGRHGLTGQELASWRAGRSLTQQEAGQMFGYSRVHWGLMERGLRPVSRPLAHMVRQLMGRQG